MFSCNRITVQRCLDQLIRYRPNIEQFPIIVSEDCQHRQTAEVIAKYRNQIVHIQVLHCISSFFCNDFELRKDINNIKCALAT